VAFQIAHVGLGANLADPVHQVRQGIRELAELPRTCLIRHSSLYRTAPVGELDQPDFVNAVAVLDTALSPRELLQELLALEARHGRVRSRPNAPRTLDLDLLLFGSQVINEPGLQVPHPRMHQRAFVLVPLVEVSPEALIPGRGSAVDLAAHLAEQPVARIDE
jgi:2-amino-4-hydroxy-6-hydroxymethyldihydropteridine diphosphokinase